MRNKGEVVVADEKVNCIDYIKRAERTRSSAYSLFKFWTRVSYRGFDLLNLVSWFIIFFLLLIYQVGL